MCHEDSLLPRLVWCSALHTQALVVACFWSLLVPANVQINAECCQVQTFLQQLQLLSKHKTSTWWLRLIHPDSLVSWIYNLSFFRLPTWFRHLRPTRPRFGSYAWRLCSFLFGDASSFGATWSIKATGWRDQSSWVILKIWRSCVKLSGFVLQHRTVFHCYTPCCNVWIVPTLSTPVPSVCSNLSLPSGRISVCQISDHSFFRSLLIHPPSCRPTRFCIQSIRKRKGLRDEGSNFAVEASMELGWRAVVPLWLSCFLPVVPLIFSASDYSIPLVGPRRSQTSCWNRVYVYLFQTPHHSTAACLRF